MGHWYGQDGSPQYYVNGRDATLRDARKNGWVPSVTEVLKVVEKPALTTWKIQQAIMAALTMPRGEESEKDYIARIMSDSKAEAISAANIGSEIHDACEKSFEYALHGDHPYYLHAHAFQLELARLFPDVTDWISEKSFAHPLGFGGKCDVHSPSTGIVVDIKSKPGDLTDGKRQHYDQNIQLAAYQVGLELVGYAEMSSDSDPDDPLLNKRWPHKFTQCANIFVSRTHPGKVCSHVWDAQDVAYGWSVFEAALELWKRLSRYNPADYIQPCAA